VKPTRLPNKAGAQSGFTMMEVMAAAMVLSIFIIGLGTSWVVADRRANDLIQRQKAVFVANAEMERLTALYNNTAYGTLGGALTIGYENSVPFPASRLTYSSAGLSPYMTSGNDYTTTSSATFQSGTGAPFLVWVATGGLGTANRNYVWLDQGQNVMARLSWVLTAVTPAQCVVGSDGCPCLGFGGSLAGSCQKLDLFLEYPFRLVSGAATTPSNIRTVSLSTIIGRTTR